MIKKIKILFLIHDLSVGGAEKVLVNLVNNMDLEKFDITVMTLFDEGVNKQFLTPHIHYKSCFKKAIPGNSHLMKLLSPRQLHKWLIKDNYDIEVSYLEGPAARVVSGCPNPKTKLVSWIHSDQKNKKMAAASFRNFAESEKCYNRFDKIVCVSDALKKSFASIYVSMWEKTCVLYNTNESDKIRSQAQEDVEDSVLDSDEFKIVGVGKIVPNKRFDSLARIHKRLLEDGLKVHTYILGVGSMQESIQKYLEDNGIEDSFTFLGYQTNPYKYVAKCDLYVCSSYAEGFSTAATEALIVGTPVCTVDVAGMKEMLGEDQEYGVITENNEEALYQGIKGLICNPELWNIYKRKSAERGNDFSTETTVRAVEAMLESLKGN